MENPCFYQIHVALAQAIDGGVPAIPTGPTSVGESHSDTAMAERYELFSHVFLF
jgi:hypothetical protein